MKSMIAGAIALLALTSGAQAQQWGAIAYSQSTGASGSSYGWGYQSDAEATAYEGCADYANDCEIAVYFESACGALAVGSNGGWGADWGYDESSASSSAVGLCSDYDAGCEVHTWQCSY